VVVRSPHDVFFRCINDQVHKPHKVEGFTMSEPSNALQVMINFINRNAQRVIRAIQLSETDHRDRVYVLRCSHCGNEYAANGTEVWERLCPFCQGGAAGLPANGSGNHSE